jgi:hypothetical protein
MLEVLEFKKRSWLRTAGFLGPLELPPRLTALKLPQSKDAQTFASASLTKLEAQDLTGELDFTTLPSTLTYFALSYASVDQCPPTIPKALPPSLKTFILRGPKSLDVSLLPSRLTHLVLRGQFSLPYESFQKLPQTLIHLGVFRMHSVSEKFWTSELALHLPNLETLRFGVVRSHKNHVIEPDWKLPPRLTHLECIESKFMSSNPQSNFWALTQLHFCQLELSEELLLQMPTQLVSIKVRLITLHGLTASHDQTLTHLSLRIILDRFEQWLSEQKKLHLRVIFSVQTTIGSLRALPPNIQTISRKLQFSPLEMRIPAPTEPKQLQMVHSRGVLQIPSSLRNMNAFSLRISEEAQCLFLDYLAHSDQVKSLTIPHQLIEVAAKMFPPQLKGLRMHPNFDPRTAIAHLPKHLTKLTFASEIELLSDLGVDFPILPCLEELTVRSEDISVLLDHKWQHHTPSLRKLSFKFVSEPQAEDFPATLQELIITKSRRIGEASSSFFEVLPRSLKFFFTPTSVQSGDA